MLHLTLVGQLPCAPDSSAAPAHAMGTMDMSAMSTAASHAAVKHQAPAQQPPQRCCEAMSGCTVSIAAASATRIVAYVRASCDIPIADRVALLSFQTAPEPPPPKA